MIRIKIIATCLFLGWNIAFGQPHFFSMSEQQINLSDKPFNVTKVSDKRSDVTNIGWTQKGMLNVKVDADFTNTLEKEVSDFLRSNLDSNGLNIQLIIRTLKISEKTTFSKEVAFCELSIDFILERKSQLFRVLQTSLTTEVSGIDVTKKHPQNIANAFKMSFDKLALIDMSNSANFLEFSSDGSTEEMPDSLEYDFPIFSEKIKTGIYADYAELKNNSPSNTDSFYLAKKERTKEPWDGTFEIIPKFQESNQKVKKVWAIAHEGQIYVLHQKEFFPLTIERYELYFYGYGVPDNQSVSTGAMVGGLIGAGIASGIENSNARKQKVKYYLDPNTGGFGKTVLEKEVR